MKQEEGNMITDWLKENGNQEIEIQVLNEALDIALESIDDFAIEFAEWLFDNYNSIKTYDKKELLEIFKKEKGL